MSLGTGFGIWMGRRVSEQVLQGYMIEIVESFRGHGAVARKTPKP